MQKNNRKKEVTLWIRYRTLQKMLLGCCLAVLFIMLTLYEIPASRAWIHWSLPLTGKVIAIDAGHGGPDGGAVSKEGSLKRILIWRSLFICEIIYSKQGQLSS